MIDTSAERVTRLRKECHDTYWQYKSSHPVYVMHRHLLLGYWENAKHTHMIVAMLAKIARLVKEVRELRKENARLIEYNAWIMEHYGVKGVANMADGKVRQ